MTLRNHAGKLRNLFVISVVALWSAATWGLDCTTTQHVTGDLALNAHWTTSSATNPCFSIDTAGVVFNLDNFSITCNNASGCGGGAIVVNANTVTIKNGFVLRGSGSFSQCINNAGGSVVRTTKVQKLVCDKATAGIIFPGTLVENSIFTGMTNGCLISVFATMPAGAKIQQNFCESAGLGISLAGPTSGTPLLIEQNYIRVTGTAVGIQQQAGLVDIEHNIIDASDPFTFAASGATLDSNICSDATECPVPTDFPFLLSFTLHF